MKESGILIKIHLHIFSFPAIYSYVLYCRDGKTPCFVNSLIPPALVVFFTFHWSYYSMKYVSQETVPRDGLDLLWPSCLD
jgi:hypothetical protein